MSRRLRATWNGCLPHTDSIARRDADCFARMSLLSDGNNLFHGEIVAAAAAARMVPRRRRRRRVAEHELGRELFRRAGRRADARFVARADERRVGRAGEELPDCVEDFVLGLDASPYGRRVVARLPEMVRRLAAYTRHGFDRDAAVLRCYLPAVGGAQFVDGGGAGAGGRAGEG